MLTPAKHRTGGNTTQSGRAPLSVKKINQLVPALSHPNLSSLLQDLKLEGTVVPARNVRSLDPGLKKNASERESNPEKIEAGAAYAKNHLRYPTHLTSHVLSSTPLMQPHESRTPVKPLRKIITTRYFIKDLPLAEIYFKAATDAALHASARALGLKFRSGFTSHQPLIPSPLHHAITPSTPNPIPGSSPFIKAQRRIHHIRYGSVEVRGKARTLREKLLRKRIAL